MFSFKKFNKKEHLEDWKKVNSANHATFITSLEWIELQRSLGKEVDQFIVYDKSVPVAIFFIEISRRKIAKYAYLPYSPVFVEDYFGDELYWSNSQKNKRSLLISFFSELRIFGKNYVRQQKLNLFKIDPYLPISYAPLLKNTGWKKSLSIGQAREMWEMQIPETETELLSKQKKDTRYYMKRGEKLGVNVIRIESVESVKDFDKLMAETENRQGFKNYASGRFQKYWEFLNPLGKCDIFIAYKNKIPLAGALMCYQNNKIFYVHGASTSNPEYSKLATPYILHFEIMKYAIAKNLKYYNFWGVVPKGIVHSFRGLSDFKMKFDGKLISNTGPYEVYTNPAKYYINRLFDYFAFKKDRY